MDFSISFFLITNPIKALLFFFVQLTCLAVANEVAVTYKYKKKLKDHQNRYIQSFDYLGDRLKRIQKLEDSKGNAILAEEVVDIDATLECVNSWPMLNHSDTKIQEIKFYRDAIEGFRKQIMLSKSEKEIEEYKQSIIKLTFAIQNRFDEINTWTMHFKTDSDFFSACESYSEAAPKMRKVTKNVNLDVFLFAFIETDCSFIFFFIEIIINSFY